MDNNLRQQLEPIIEEYRGKQGNLIPVLHEIQNKVGYLPEEVQEYVAQKLKVPLSRICGVITFYSFFSTEPKGDHTIGICMGTACYVKGGDDILTAVKDQLAIDVGDTTGDGRFTMTVTRCLGTCSMAPVIMIDDQVFGEVTVDRVPEILEQY